MTTLAVAFVEIVLAVHIIAALIAFGVTFAYPIITTAIERSDPRALPSLHRAQHLVGTRLLASSHAEAGARAADAVCGSGPSA